MYAEVLYSRERTTFGAKLSRHLYDCIAVYTPKCMLRTVSLVQRPTLNSLSSLVKKHDISLIHSNNQPYRDIFAVLLSRRHDLPLLSFVRSVSSGGYSRNLAKCLNSSVTYYIANSSFTLNYWLRLGIDKNKTTVVYNAVPDLKPNEQTFAELPKACAGEKLVGYVGRLVGSKRVALLIDAFAHICKQRDDASLILIGDGEDRIALEKKVADKELQASVHFLGRQEGVQNYMRQFDMLVLPSRDEPFGRVLIEAMQVGCPVIGMNSGGVSEIIASGVNGILLDEVDSDVLAGEIVAL